MNIKGKIKFNAGFPKEDIINEDILDFEKRKIMVKTRVLNLITNTINDIEYIKRDITSPIYSPSQIYNPAGTKEEPFTAEEMASLKRMAYKILKEKFSLIEEAIEKNFNETKKEEQ